MQQILSPVLILGARSDIGKALARTYAAQGCDLILAARRAGELEADCADLAVRHGVNARVAEFDVTDGAPDRFFAGLGAKPGTIVLVAGLLGDQDQALDDDSAAALIMETNYAGPARYLLAAARVMEPGSAIIGIGSVAGERGRGSNFVYGSAKAGLSAFLSGLRNRLAGRQIHVLTVKPGFVDTQMTAGMNLPKALTASPEQVARAIVRAQRRGRNEIYSKPIWRPIMQMIRLIPEPIFKKMSL